MLSSLFQKRSTLQRSNSFAFFHRSHPEAFYTVIVQCDVILLSFGKEANQGIPSFSLLCKGENKTICVGSDKDESPILPTPCYHPDTFSPQQHTTVTTALPTPVPLPLYLRIFTPISVKRTRGSGVCPRKPAYASSLSHSSGDRQRPSALGAPRWMRVRHR